jgi:hypothetical protein
MLEPVLAFDVLFMVVWLFFECSTLNEHLFCLKLSKLTNSIDALEQTRFQQGNELFAKKSSALN